MYDINYQSIVCEPCNIVLTSIFNSNKVYKFKKSLEIKTKAFIYSWANKCFCVGAAFWK